MSTAVGPERTSVTTGAVTIATVAVIMATVARRRESAAAASSAPGIANSPAGDPSGNTSEAAITQSGIQ